MYFLFLKMTKRLSLDTLEKRRSAESKKLDDIKNKIRANQDKSKEVSKLKLSVREMADAYEDALACYKGFKKQVFSNRIQEESASFKMLARAVVYAKELGIDSDTYMRGLFYISNKWWNKAPSTREISDYKTKIPAKERVSIYLKEVAQGEVKKDKKIVGAVQKIVVPQSVKSRQSAAQMCNFMRNYNMTEEEVFVNFGKGTEAFLYFDKNWLLENETYQRLRKEGRI